MQDIPMLLERTLVYICMVLFALGLLPEQPVVLTIASERLRPRLDGP